MRPARVLGVANPMSFPDDMSDDEIKAILQQKFNADTMKRATGEISDALTPVKSMAAPYEPSLMERASLGIGGALHDSGIISNKSGAYQIGKNVTAIGEMLPGIGDVAAVDDFSRAAASGDNLGMGLAALGVLPVGGDLAKKAGKKFERLYHGSPIEFDEFDPARVGDRLTSLGLGHYLTPNKSTAAEYGDNIMEFDVDTSDILDWQNLKPNQRDEIESKLMEAIPAPRIAGFGEKKFEVLPANKEGAKRFKELKEQTKDVYHHAARAKTLTDDEIIKNHPGLIDKIGLEDNVVEWREGGNLKGANDQQLMTLMNEYSPDLARHLGYKGSRFSDQVAIYDSKLATKINKTSQAPVDVARKLVDDIELKYKSDIAPLQAEYRAGASAERKAEILKQSKELRQPLDAAKSDLLRLDMAAKPKAKPVEVKAEPDKTFKGKVFHQTSEQFDEFDLSKGADGTAWFTGDKKNFADPASSASAASGKGRVLEREVELKKVAGFDELDKYSIDELRQQGYDGAVLDGDIQVFDQKAIKPPVDVASNIKPAFKANQGAANMDAMLDLLKPKGQTANIGFEKGAVKKDGIAKFTSPNGSTRYVMMDGGEPVSALQIMSRDGKDGVISNVFTLPSNQKKGLASKLMSKAKKDFKSIKHSDELTEQGARFANSVEGTSQAPVDVASNIIKADAMGEFTKFSDKVAARRGAKLSVWDLPTKGKAENIKHITDLQGYTPEQLVNQMKTLDNAGIRQGGYLKKGDGLDIFYKDNGTSDMIDPKTGNVVFANDVEQTGNIIKDDILNTAEGVLTPEQRATEFQARKANDAINNAREAALQDSYKMQHTAPMRGDNPSGDDLTAVFDKDIYTGNAKRFFGTGASYDDKAIKVIQGMKGKPEKSVTIYRAVPKDVKEINATDWITTTKEYAQDHMEGEKGWHILSKKVKAKDIATDGNSIHEFGYDPLN